MRLVPWVAVLVGVTMIAPACTSDSERATDIATAQVRDNASRGLEVLEESLADPDAGRGQELVDQVRARLPASPDVILFDTQVDDDGSVTWRVAFHARGEAGGGLLYEAVVARLCVELIADPGPPPAAEMRDTSCPRELPGSAGDVDVTVRLGR